MYGYDGHVRRRFAELLALGRDPWSVAARRWRDFAAARAWCAPYRARFADPGLCDHVPLIMMMNAAIYVETDGPYPASERAQVLGTMTRLFCDCLGQGMFSAGPATGVGAEHIEAESERFAAAVFPADVGAAFRTQMAQLITQHS
jgi:hypothetical protein